MSVAIRSFAFQQVLSIISYYISVDFSIYLYFLCFCGQRRFSCRLKGHNLLFAYFLSKKLANPLRSISSCLFPFGKAHRTLSAVWTLRIHSSTRKIAYPRHVIEIFFVSGMERDCFVSVLRILIPFHSRSLSWSSSIFESSSFFLPFSLGF